MEVRRLHADLTSIGYLAHAIEHAFLVIKADSVVEWRGGWVRFTDTFREQG